MDGVVAIASAIFNYAAFSPSNTALQEFLVPKLQSPMILLMVCLSNKFVYYNDDSVFGPAFLYFKR